MRLKNIFYFQSVLNSFRIVFQNKILWFLGVFAVLLGTGEWVNFISSDFFQIGRTQRFILKIFVNKVFWDNFFQKVYQNWVGFIGMLILLLAIIIIFIVFVYLAVIAQGGLIFSLFKIKNKKKIKLKESLQLGKSNFWPVLTLNIIEKYIVWIFSFLLGIFSFLDFNHLIDIKKWWLFLFFLFIVLFLLIFSFIVKYALSYIILKGYSPFLSLKKAFLLFFKNFLINFEMSLLLFGINYLFHLSVIFLTILISTILWAPLNFIGGAGLYFSANVSFFFYFVFIPILIVLFVVWAFALLTAYNYSVWVDMFLLLESKKSISSFIGRLFKKMIYGR